MVVSIASPPAADKARKRFSRDIGVPPVPITERRDRRALRIPPAILRRATAAMNREFAQNGQIPLKADIFRHSGKSPGGYRPAWPDCGAGDDRRRPGRRKPKIRESDKNGCAAPRWKARRDH